MLNKDDQIEKLIELNDELENYFRNTIIPQLFVDSNLILRKFTPPAMKQFSLSNSDIGKQIADVKENLRFPTIVENIQQVIDSNELLEKEIQTIDFRWYQMNILPYIIKKENRVNGVIITFVEITRRIKDLKEQERLISDHESLLDSLSHDFKTPITSLALTVDRLKNVIPAEMNTVHPLLILVESGVKKMQKIILELTDSRNQEFKYKAEEELLNIEHVLEDVIHTLSDHILESSAVINMEIEISEITYSRRKLRSIIYNLVLNSIKYRSPERNPEINIKTGSDGEYFTVTIADNGSGIHPDKHDKIFSKYFRAERTSEGSGLGLYIVSQMVHNSGGKISLHSEEGKGSEFKIFLKRQ